MSKNQRTREAIKSAFLNLIKEADMDSINTKDIMEIAGGARSNFYNYFSDKFDLRNAIMQDELKVTERLLNSFFRENDKLLNEEKVLALNTIRFDHIYESRELYKALFTTECFRGFPEMLRETMEKGLSYRFQMMMGENTKIPVNSSFRAYMMSALFVSTIAYWAMTDFSQTPERLCQDYTLYFMPRFRPEAADPF